jgi:hypothetical protein
MAMNTPSPAVRLASLPAALALFVVMSPATSSAASPALCPATTPATPDTAARAAARVQEIALALRSEAQYARRWTWGWGIGYAALTVGQAAPLPFVADPGLRADLAVGAATSAIGLATLAVMPPEVLTSSATLDRELGAGALNADPCRLLERAETLLARAADDEAMATGPLMHAANAALNIVAGLVLGLGYDRWASGAITAASGIAIGEVMILTAPTALIDSRPAEANAPTASAPPFMLVPWAGARTAGLQLSFSFYATTQPPTRRRTHDSARPQVQPPVPLGRPRRLRGRHGGSADTVAKPRRHHAAGRAALRRQRSQRERPHPRLSPEIGRAHV